jgi:hypothetical protein
MKIQTLSILWNISENYEALLKNGERIIKIESLLMIRWNGILSLPPMAKGNF